MGLLTGKLWHDQGGFDEFADALVDGQVLDAPQELLDAAAADALGADVQRRGGGVEMVQIGHFIVAGDQLDVASLADGDAGGGEGGIDGGDMAVLGDEQAARAGVQGDELLGELAGGGGVELPEIMRRFQGAAQHAHLAAGVDDVLAKRQFANLQSPRGGGGAEKGALRASTLEEVISGEAADEGVVGHHLIAPSRGKTIRHQPNGGQSAQLHFDEFTGLLAVQEQPADALLENPAGEFVRV